MTDLLSRTSAAVEAAGATDRTSWLFTRCWIRTVRFEDDRADTASLDAALADYEHLPPDWPGRSKLAAVLVVAQLRAGVLQDPKRLAAAIRLSEIADSDSSPLPDWPEAYAVMRASELMRAGMDGAPGFSPRAALIEVEKYAGVVGEQQPHVQMIDLARVSLRHLVAQQDSSPAATAEVAGDVGRIRESHGPDSPLHDRARILDALVRGNSAALRGDMVTAAERLHDVLAMARSLPPGDHLRTQIDQMRAMVEPLLTMLGSDPETWRTDSVRIDPHLVEQLTDMERRATAGDLSPADQALQLSTLATAELATGTPAAVDRAVEHLEKALDVIPEHDPRRPFFLMTLGVAFVQRYEMMRRPGDLMAGTTALERARELAGSSASTNWTLSAMPLAHAYRLSGRLAKGREVALSGLRGHAWTVLLQANPPDAQAAARHAAGDAVDVARWCLADDDPENAVTALDSGRGLILYAATETKDIETRLRSLNEQDLADEWRQVSSTTALADIPSELRRRAVSALAGIPLTADGSMSMSPTQGSSRLLDPPSLHEIRAALKATGGDALVYLVPGEERTGAAVVVSAEEPPSWLPLPDLNRTALSGFAGYLSDAARSMRAGTARPRLGALEEICDWAWTAAIGPLLDEHLTLPAGRPVRLVLVPMGELARIPWQAARERMAGGSNYALRRAVFSFTVSARLLCESAWLKTVPLTGPGLIVGDPDTHDRDVADLPLARLEAAAIREAFYPDAVYVGRRPDGATAPSGAGHPAEVLTWLAGPTGGSMMHLACHAEMLAGSSGDSSYLLLADGRLSAEEMVRTLSTQKGRDLALAVLAACSSGESSRGYDEAFSIATAFLTSGIRSVISAQWSVSDAPTSLLMFMVHHFMREEELSPADALREAQLWMIDDRQPPGTMPSDLCRLLDSPAATDLASWAAFSHLGR